jgi:hypothetical protein
LPRARWPSRLRAPAYRRSGNLIRRKPLASCAAVAGNGHDYVGAKGGARASGVLRETDPLWIGRHYGGKSR